MKPQAKKPFDHSQVPDDLCPIATERAELRTGEWRAERPQVNRTRCTQCATCWLYCPTQCIVEKPAWFEAELTICKGCGICARECPHQAVSMIPELED